MLKQLKNLCLDLNLNNKEQSVLLDLYQNGSSMVSKLAKRTKINRTTAYGILKSLKEKGLVSSIKKSHATIYQPLNAKLLVDYVERKQSELSKRKDEIKEILPQLEEVERGKNSLPKIRFFEGVEGVKQAYEDTLNNNENKKLLDLTGTDAVFEKMGEDWVDYYVKKRAKLGISCEDIAPDTDWSRKSKKRDRELNRVTKLLPKEYIFNTEIDIYDKKVAFFTFSKDQPIALIVEDKEISETMKTLFEYINNSLESTKNN